MPNRNGICVLKTGCLITVLLLLLYPTILCSCDFITGNEAVPSVPAYTPGVTPEIPSFTDEELVSLGLDEIQTGMYHERGVLNVDSAETASVLAGFRISPPSFLPEGLSRGPYSVAISGAGLPEAMKPKFNNTTVTVIYSSPNDPRIMLALIYMVHHTGIGAGEAAQIGDYEGMRVYQPASGNGYPSLGLVWGEDTRYFNIAATLGGPLDEETVMMIAESIPIE